MMLSPQDAELARLEVLHAYKRRFGGDGRVNRSPFEQGQIVRYLDDVRAQDVPEIHQQVRQRIQDILTEVRRGDGSRVVILTGEPGMGKSHLINFFRPPEQARRGGYVLVGNSNHWKCSEFEACLLDWILEALLRPGPQGPHLLLEKIEDVAFQALAQLLNKPGEIDRYLAGGRTGAIGRLWRRLAGNSHARFQKYLEKRDSGAFRRLDFGKFADHVCARFLHESGHPFHRYVLQVLLRHLFPAEREHVVHWLRRRPVGDHFLRRLGAADGIDANYKVIDTIKVLISLFSDEVAAGLSLGAAAPSTPLVFFFAFDQPEGRDELFDSDGDWRRFFAHLSELYNGLPNVFILFTMTAALGKRLHSSMEAQFRDRIQRDHKFVLHAVEDPEVLALYRRHVENWLGPVSGEVLPRIKELGNPYLPFDQRQVVEMARRRTLRDMLREFDRRFREVMVNLPTKDPVLDYRTFQNEIRRDEPADSPYAYTAGHLRVVRDLFSQFGPAVARRAGLAFSGAFASDDSDAPRHLELYFHAPEDPSRWVRVFVCRLTMQWKKWAEKFIDRLAHRQRSKNLLFLLRNRDFDLKIPLGREQQIFPRVYPASVHTDFQAMLRLLANRGGYDDAHWQVCEHLLLGELDRTYVGDVLKQVQRAVQRQRGLEEFEEDVAPEPARIEEATAGAAPGAASPLEEMDDEE
jgi:hypothetical protein